MRQLLERAVEVPITEPARWFSMVQLLTEGGQLDRASAMLAEIARGDHPEALDRRRLRGDPARISLPASAWNAPGSGLRGGNDLDRGDPQRLDVAADHPRVADRQNEGARRAG